MAETGNAVPQRRKSLRLLCLHGHGGYGERMCAQMEQSFMKLMSAANSGSSGTTPPIDVECRCIDAPFAESSRRSQGRQWWRYDGDGWGDRPDDFAEMEVAATRVSQELYEGPGAPYDGLLGFSQGAEMVHTAVLLASRGDPRFDFTKVGSPRFAVSLSGAVNPAYFEAVGAAAGVAGSPPLLPGWGSTPGAKESFDRWCPPLLGDLTVPCLFVGDFLKDSWYPAPRYEDTLGLYGDAATVVRHNVKHTVPKPADLEPREAAAVRQFLTRAANEASLVE